MNRFTLVALAIGTSVAVYPQRLYNQAQDTRATEAKTAAAAIASTTVFDTALRNLTELEKQRQADYVRNQRALLSANLSAWSTWQSVFDSVDQVSTDLGFDAPSDPANFAEELARISKQQAEVSAEVEALKRSIAAAAQGERSVVIVGEWLGEIGKLAPAADLILRLQGETPTDSNLRAARAATASLAQLAALYKGFSSGLPTRPGALYLQMQLKLLKAEEKSILRQVEIEERRLRETSPSLEMAALVKSLTALAQVQPGAKIAESLDQQAERVRAAPTDESETKKLASMVQLLYVAGALVSRSALPSDTARARRSLEIRAHSLTQSQIVAGVYQQLLFNGAQRLSAYYKGGIRPQTVADLIQAAASVGLIPAILTR